MEGFGAKKSLEKEYYSLYFPICSITNYIGKAQQEL